MDDILAFLPEIRSREPKILVAVLGRLSMFSSIVSSNVNQSFDLITSELVTIFPSESGLNFTRF